MPEPINVDPNMSVAPALVSPSVSICKTILPATIAKNRLTEIAKTLETLGKTPSLVAFLANKDPHAMQYAEWSKKTCEENGFKFELRIVDPQEIEAKIVEANEDDSVDGIMVYYPIFPDNLMQDKYIQETVALEKDVEGLRHTHLYNMYHNIRYLDPPHNLQKSILPCTPLAVVKIMEHLQLYNPLLSYGNRLYGRTITVINRSEVNGRPLAALLANDGATVYSVDINSVQMFTRGEGIRYVRYIVHKKPGWTVDDCLPLSDVVIGGVPSESYKVKTELVRQGAICINFSSYRNFDNPAIKERAAIYVPSVGKVTISMLLRNTVRLITNRAIFKAQKENEAKLLAKAEAIIETEKARA